MCHKHISKYEQAGLLTFFSFIWYSSVQMTGKHSFTPLLIVICLLHCLPCWRSLKSHCIPSGPSLSLLAALNDLPIEGASTPSFRSLLQYHFLFLKKILLFICLFVFGCARSSLLHRLVSTCSLVAECCSLVASHCSGLSWWAWTLGHGASVDEAHGLFSCDPWAPENRCDSCGT